MKRYIFVILISIVAVSATRAQLVINELMSNNVSYKMDEMWNYCMWVEICNTSNSTVNQSDYYFTDDLSEPLKWRPSSKSIASRGFSVLWFEREKV